MRVFIETVPESSPTRLDVVLGICTAVDTNPKLPQARGSGGREQSPQLHVDGRAPSPRGKGGHVAWGPPAPTTTPGRTPRDPEQAVPGHATALGSEGRMFWK